MNLEEKVKAVLNEVYDGLHHLPNKLKDHKFYFELNHYGDLSTWDFNRLTVLVLAAHEHCVRVEISSSGPGMVKLLFHDRNRTGKGWDSHPTIEEALKNYRNKWGHK
jgi:hypothetical protein